MTGLASGPAARELAAEVVIHAPPERVWALVTDFGRMPEWSPELISMWPLGRGGLRLGQQYVGVNRRKAVVWPTRSRIAVLEEGRVVGWDTLTSGARWIYEVEPEGDGTRLRHRRPVPRRLTPVSNLFAKALLGGAEGHADELEAGMQQTLQRIKAVAEA